jgi:hypothetical protein
MDTTEPARPDWWDSFLERVDALDPTMSLWEQSLWIQREFPEAWRDSGLLDPVIWALHAWLDPSNTRAPFSGLDHVLVHWREMHDEVGGHGPSSMRARFSDFAWLKSRRPQHAIAAVEAYLDSSRRDEQVRSAVGQELHRAWVIAIVLKNEDLLRRTQELALELLRDEGRSLDTRVGAARVFAEEGGDVSREIAAFLESVIGSFGDEPVADWDWRRSIARLAASAWKAAKERDGTVRMRRAAARLHVDQATALEGAGAAAMLVAQCWSRAVRALRDEGLMEEAEDAHRRLLEVQRRSVAEMKSIRGPSVDVTDAALAAIDAVRGKPFREQLETLVALVPRPTVGSLQRLAEESVKQSVFLSIVSYQVVDAQGRRLRSPSPVERQVLVHAAERRGCAAKALIEPARRQIALESPGRLEDWFDFLRDLPLVDETRIFGLATGLAAGLAGDWIVSTSVLVLQIEHLVRTLAGQAHEITSTLNADGTQREKLFSELLKNEKVGRILGEDWIFDLQALLVEPGSNLRNRVAHGMVPDQEFYTTDSVYLWYLVLDLVLSVGVVRAPQAGDTETDVASEDTASVD